MIRLAALAMLCALPLLAAAEPSAEEETVLAALERGGLRADRVKIFVRDNDIERNDVPASPELRSQALSRLVSMLKRMPRMLAGVYLSELKWTISTHRPFGYAGRWQDLELHGPLDGDLAPILAHELAHVLEYSHPTLARDFLALRRRNPEVDSLIGEFQEERRLNREDPLSPKAEELLARARLPRRYPGDIWAASSPTEYWGVSVQLAFISWESGEGPSKALEPDEAAFLFERF